MNQTEAKLTNKRPSLLTIICVFSFIGLAYSVMSTLMSLASSESILNSFYDLESVYPENNILKGLSEYAYRIETYGSILLLFELIFNAFCLVGVLLMWNMRKVGYYFYLFGEISPIIVYFILIGFVSTIPDVIIIIHTIIALLFSILYATQLRFLR